jgi:diguanylate cyclase (GGDEF)-like protein
VTKKKRIGFIIDWIGSLYHAKLVEGVRRACRERGAELTIYMCGRMGSDLPSEKGSTLVFGLPDQDNLDALVVGGAGQLYFSGMEPFADYLKRFGKKPVVTLGFEIPGYPGALIDTDESTRDLVRHLVNHHHFRDFYCVTGHQTNGESSQRLFALQEGLFELGITLSPDNIHYGDFLYESGRQAGVHIASRAKLPQVVFCFSDSQACGVLDEFDKRGIHVPEDVAVTGFDNGDVGRFNKLTTIDIPFAEQAYRAAQYCIDRLDGMTHLPVPLTGSLIVRSSCGCGAIPKTDFSMERMSLSDHFVADYDLEIINEMGVLLYSSIEQPDMVPILRRQMARLDISSFYIGFCSDPSDPLDELRGFAAVCKGKPNSRFQSKTIPRAELVRDLRNHIGQDGELMILSLFQGDSILGIFALSPGGKEIKLHELIRQLLSGVIKGRLLFEQLKDSNRQLEEMVNLRTGQLQETNNRLRQALSELEQHNRNLHRESILDPLTGLHNRRGLKLKGIPLLDRSLKTGLKQMLLFIDLDGLKTINDTFGHDEGDRALVKTAEILSGCFRSRDILSRLGGDEFVVMTGEGNPDTPDLVIKRMAREIEKVNREGELPFTLSFSTGYAWLDPDGVTGNKDPSELFEVLLSEADRQLYINKKSRKPSGG